VRYRPEQEHDHAAIRQVHALAFGNPDRVPDLVDDLRTTPAPLAPLSLVATVEESQGERVVWHVMLSGCRLDAPERLVAVYSLSPLGVLPDLQRSGIGTALIRHALSAADAQGVPLVFVEGSPSYYGARGFDDVELLGFRPPTLRYPRVRTGSLGCRRTRTGCMARSSTPTSSGPMTASACGASGCARSSKPRADD
jgi:putative acetyltransferase